jgi:hypothetical protein
MSTTLLPLFDAFTQSLRNVDYDPVTNWSRFFNFTPAVSLFTFNTDDQEVEQAVIDHVGSYGSQLSTILKMLDVLHRHVPSTGLDETDQEAVDEFNQLLSNSQAVVAEHKGELGIGDEKRVAAYLTKAAKGDFGPKVFKELKEIFTNPPSGNEGAKHAPEPVRSSQ